MDNFFAGVAVTVFVVLMCNALTDCTPPRFHQSLEARCRQTCLDEQTPTFGSWDETARVCVCADGRVYNVWTSVHRISR